MSKVGWSTGNFNPSTITTVTSGTTVTTVTTGNTVAVRMRLRFYAADGFSTITNTVTSSTTVTSATTVTNSTTVTTTTTVAGAPGTVLAGVTYNPIAFESGTVFGFVPQAITFAIPTVTSGATVVHFWAGITYDNNSGIPTTVTNTTSVAAGTTVTTTSVIAPATVAQMNNFGQALLDPPVVGSSGDVLAQSTGPFGPGGAYFANQPPVGYFNFGHSTTPAQPVANAYWYFEAPRPTPNISGKITFDSIVPTAVKQSVTFVLRPVNGVGDITKPHLSGQTVSIL